MNTQKILGTTFSYPLHKSYANNLLQLLKELQNEIIITKDDYQNFNLLFELEFKLYNLIKSKGELTDLVFSISSSQAVIGLIDDIFFKLFKESHKIKRYRSLFEFKQQLYNLYSSQVSVAYEQYKD